MDNFGRGNWFLMVGLFVVGMMVFVGAVGWDSAAYVGINYTTVEDSIVPYYHDLRLNLSSSGTDLVFSIDPAVDRTIKWTNGTVTYNYSSVDVISDWINIINSSTGNLTINATEDSQTGYFSIPLSVTNVSAGADSNDFDIKYFEFIINATNDAPNFTSSGIVNNYSFLANSFVQNFTLTASDEESHFPLVFDIVFNTTNCTHGAGTGYNDNENCSLLDFGLTLTNFSNESAVLSFGPNTSYVGTYWANVSVMDAAVNYDCPHDWCDATYNTTNLTTYYSEMVKFTVYPTLAIDATNCTGATLMEYEEFNCTIIITTPNEEDALTLTSDASFRTGTGSPDDSSWFYSDNSVNSSNFNYNVSVSVTPTKIDVGNWTINFTVDNGISDVVSDSILLYVNYTESDVILDSISNRTLYDNYNLSVIGFDEDLLILDNSVKNENLTFNSNTSWVSYDSKVTLSSTNYSTAIFNVDYDSVLANNGTGNYSIFINVTDEIGNTDNQTFVIEILNETAPEWNDTLVFPISLNLTEGVLFTYNVSMNVTDEEGNNITFYYENISAEFCSLNSTNFNYSTGIINFTPTDCDVGYHNVSIIASNLKLNSTAREFNFTVNNIADNPSIIEFKANNGSSQNLVENPNLVVAEASEVVFNITLQDEDFLIPSGQRDDFYNESLTIDITFTNSSDVDVTDLFDFSFIGESGLYSSSVDYGASFTPSGAQVDNYTIFVNIIDVSGASINRTFYLNISEVSDPPNFTTIENQSVTIHDILSFTVSASDEEDDRNGVNLSYSIVILSVGAPNLTIGSETGVVTFDMDSNSSYAGAWKYNVSVTDSDSKIDWQEIYVYVYGNASLISPSSGSVFNLTENLEGVLNFTINHSVGDNLTYEFWIDSISCSFQNNSDCSYGNLSLRETNNSFGNGSVYGWTFTPNYTDETYNNSKNITVSVYPNTENLTSTQKAAVATNFSFKLDINHTNAPPEILVGFGSNSGTYGTATPITITLTENIRDYDYLDSYYLQDVTFGVTSAEGVNSQLYAEGSAGANSLPWNGTIDDWSLQLYALTALEELVSVSANDSFESVTSDSFRVTFTAPSETVITVPRSGGGSTTKIKHYSLKLIAPQDVVISELGFIEIPFAVQNNGQVDLRGISLDSFVTFNDAFSDDVKISIGDSYIEELKFGQSENFTMRIVANTQRAGKYKATILANVTSPKFSDFADFFIEIKKANESEAEQILIFTDKFVADNPECLELTELLNEAEKAFSLGEYSNSVKIAREVTEACEDAIEANEQVRYKVEGFVEDNFYYISFATLVIFFAGFVFYVYKRVRFNKSGMDEYV